jgi:hypothetical protein
MYVFICRFALILDMEAGAMDDALLGVSPVSSMLEEHSYGVVYLARLEEKERNVVIIVVM